MSVRVQPPWSMSSLWFWLWAPSRHAKANSIVLSAVKGCHLFQLLLLSPFALFSLCWSLREKEKSGVNSGNLSPSTPAGCLLPVDEWGWGCCQNPVGESCTTGPVCRLTTFVPSLQDSTRQTPPSEKPDNEKILFQGQASQHHFCYFTLSLFSPPPPTHLAGCAGRWMHIHRPPSIPISLFIFWVCLKINSLNSPQIF